MRKVRCDSAARAVPLPGRDGAVPVDDRVLDLLEGDGAVVAPLVGDRSGGRSSEAGGTRPSYGRPSGHRPGQGPAGEQSLPHGSSKADAGASGTVSSDAAYGQRRTW